MKPYIPHARSRMQVRLELLAKALVIIVLVACVFVAWSSVDPEIASRR